MQIKLAIPEGGKGLHGPAKIREAAFHMFRSSLDMYEVHTYELSPISFLPCQGFQSPRRQLFQGTPPLWCSVSSAAGGTRTRSLIALVYVGSRQAQQDAFPHFCHAFQPLGTLSHFRCRGRVRLQREGARLEVCSGEPGLSRSNGLVGQDIGF